MNRWLCAVALIGVSCGTVKPEVKAQPTPFFFKQTTTNSIVEETDATVGIIRFDGTINEQTVALLEKLLYRAIDNDDLKQIVIEIDTDGGSVESGQYLSRLIERSKKPITCVIDGEADSMGFYVLQSCPKRLMTKRSILMVHEPSVKEGAGNEHNVQFYFDMLHVLNFGLAEHMSSRMKLSADDLRSKISNRAWWMNAKEALEVGAVDGVVTSVESVIFTLKE